MAEGGFAAGAGARNGHQPDIGGVFPAPRDLLAQLSQLIRVPRLAHQNKVGGVGPGGAVDARHTGKPRAPGKARGLVKRAGIGVLLGKVRHPARELIAGILQDQPR